MSRAWLIGSVVLLLGAGFVVESKALTQTPSPTSTTTPTGIVVTGCPGDCDNGGEVTVDEVITAVSIALGDLSLDMCRSVDVDGDGSVSIDELIMAVSAALSGCGSPQGDSFEPDNNPQTARSIACNATQTRSLSPVGDVDWLMVSLPQRMDVVIETSGASSDTILNLFDANLTFLEYNDDGGQHGFSRIHRVCGSNALEDGLYFFNVGSYTGASIPQYQVAVTCQPCNVANPTNSPTPTSTPTPPPPAPDTYEPDDTSSTAPSIGCGEVQRHTISPFDDIDWMRLSLSERTAVRLQTFGEYYLAMSLYDAQGAFLANSTSIDLQCGINALEPGEYFIELNGYSDTPTSYDVSVLCFPCDQSNPTPLPTQTFEPTWTPAPTFTPAPRDAYEPDDSRGSAQPLQCGELQHHSLSPFDDRDWMELTVSQRSAVRIETASDSYSFSATLSDTSGTNLESSFYSSLAVWDRACGVDALDAGTYFVEVNKTFFSDPDIAYEVGVVCFPCGLPNPTVTPTPTPFLTTTPTSTPTSALRDTFEPDNSAAAAKPIQCGEGQQHTLVPIGDVDWLRLTLPQRSEVHIEAVGQSGDYYAQELNLSLLDTTGTVIDELTYAFPAHIDRACGFDALDAGTYRIEVAQPYAFSGGVGYLVTVSCAPCAVPNQTPTATFTATPTWTPSPTPILLQPDVFEPDDDTAAAKAIQCGEGQLRTLAPTGDVDWVKLVLSQRSTVRIDASSRDFAIDAALLAEDGTPLETSNYAFDVRYDRICGTDALEPGTYYIRFNQTFATFEPTFAYDVSVLCAPCELPNPPSTPTPTPQPTWTPESTLTPGMRDPSEPDNVAALAPYIYCGSTQHHSIVPANDVDWLRFTLPERAGVVIQTSDYSTQVSLFDAQPVQIDAGYPQIQRLCDTGALAAGDYFLQVRSFGDVVPDYEVSVICLPCEGSGSTPRPTFTSTITPTPTVTPTPTATRTPRNTPTPCATQPCAAPVCGDGVVGADEDCDDGGTCIGGANAGSVCFAETDCHGDGICVDGARRFAACSDDADCTGGRCVHCVPQGGDGCAANCTTESDVPFTLVPGQFDGLNIARGTSGAAIGSDFLSIPLPLAGSQTLTIGRQLDGKIPFVVKVSSVDYPAIPVSSLACGCIRGAAAKTCGGMFFEADGMTLATDCTPGTTLGDSVCTAAGKAPCAFVHGAGNTMSGEIGCAAEDTIDVDVSQDSGGSGGPCAFPNVCAFHVALNGAGGPGSAVALNTFSLTAVLGNCSGGDPGTYGPDGIFCTADDPTGGLIGITATLPAVTGTATAVVLNANGSDGSAVGPATATGAPFNCAALAQGNATGAGFAQAFTFVRLDTIGDAVIAESLFAQ